MGMNKPSTISMKEFIDSVFGKAMLAATDEETVRNCYLNTLEFYGCSLELERNSTTEQVFSESSPYLLLTLFAWCYTDEGNDFWRGVFEDMGGEM